MLVDIDEYAEGAILLDDLEEAIIGIVEDFGSPGKKILYSKRKILNILQERDLMTESEADALRSRKDIEHVRFVPSRVEGYPISQKLLYIGIR